MRRKGTICAQPVNVSMRIASTVSHWVVEVSESAGLNGSESAYDPEAQFCTSP